VTTAGEHVVPRYLASFRAGYPEAEVVLEVGNRTRVWELLDSHTFPPSSAKDAVARELEQGLLEEWRCEGLGRDRSWYLVGPAAEELPPTTALFLGFRLVDHQPHARETG